MTTNIVCPVCKQNKLRQDEKHVSFASGDAPRHLLTIKLRATWCPNGTCASKPQLEELKSPTIMPGF